MEPTIRQGQAEWVSFFKSVRFFLGHASLLGWGILLAMLTCLLTWLAFHFGLKFILQLTGDFFLTPPPAESVWGWVKYGGWQLTRFLFHLTAQIVTFYLAFLLAFSLTTPGYAFLSRAVECKLKNRIAGQGFSVQSVCRDLAEGAKIGLFGVLVAAVSLAAGFIPLIGPAAVLVIYTYYSALMLIDYPASQRNWTLGRKINWLLRHNRAAFKLGFLPALIGMIPIFNIFLIALIFPMMTVHAALNFSAIENQ
ncbi:MAG: cysteine biosynthesis protein [Deltaproteobacteria bacterium]|nr:MAG: cysteine biosynthesis protein [Deltaproteobacteria bacterium]